MKPTEGLALFEKIIFGWLPREPGTSSGLSKRPLASRSGRLASFFVFEFLVLFVILEVLQLAGLGVDSSFIAGLVGGVAAAAGSVLFLKGAEGRRLPAEADQAHDKRGGP